MSRDLAFSYYTFSIDGGKDNEDFKKAKDAGWTQIGLRQACDNSKYDGIFGSDTENWKYVDFNKTAPANYTHIEVPRCKKGNSRSVKKYKIHLCKSAKKGDCKGVCGMDREPCHQRNSKVNKALELFDPNPWKCTLPPP